MEKIKLIETSIAIIMYVLIRIITYKSIDKTVASSLIQKTRSKIMKKAMNLILLLVFSICILIIWGVDQSELAVFIGSVLTVIGIALFAQWSILANITSGIILFFYHSVKLDQHISILDKDYEVTGRVSDISLFFVLLKTPDGEEVSIPNSVFIQKMIKKKSQVSN